MEICIGPITLTHSQNNIKTSKHFVASRIIHPGELVLQDVQIFTIPKPTENNCIGICCLNCYKELDLKNYSVCDQCQWPVCDSVCAKGQDHANFECQTLKVNRVPFDLLRSPYLCIQTLRGLLMKEKSPEEYKSIRALDPHIEARAKVPDKIIETAFVVDFIHNKCKLKSSFDDLAVEHILGVTDFSPYSLIQDNRNATMLLFLSSFFAHDCAPNLSRITIKSKRNDGSIQYGVKFIANQHINAGAVLTTAYYKNFIPNVLKRRGELKQMFLFNCTCKLCQREMNELQIKKWSRVPIAKIEELNGTAL